MSTKDAPHPFIPVPEGVSLESLWHRDAIRIVINRDGIACWLCGIAVDLHAGPREARSATIDHVTPRAFKGLSTTLNYRLAHARCNTMRLVYWPETLHLKGREAFVPAHKGIWEEYERKRARKMNPDPKPVQAKKPAPKLSDRIEPPSAWEAYDRALKEHRESTLARAREIGNAMVRHDDRG